MYTMLQMMVFGDGCIKMSGTTTQTPPQDYGAKMYNTGDIDGAAWGAEVVGWLDFKEVETSIIFGCTDSGADNYDPDATVDDESCVPPGPNPPTPGDYCSNSPIPGQNNTSITVEIESEFDDYNTLANQNGWAPMIYDGVPGTPGDTCRLKGDLCPYNLDYEGTESDIEDALGVGDQLNGIKT